MADIDVREGLLSGAYQIRDEQNMNGNTAARVGQMFVDIINAMTLMGGGGGIDPDTLKEILSKIDFSAYLKIEDARKIYLTIQDAIRTYLSKEEARLVYLTIEDAANTYLSKVAPDTAKELITFLKGIAIADGTYGIDSDGKGTFADVSSKTFHSPIFKHAIMNGKGWDVDSDGNMQVESLEVRSALRVLELVYNRLSAEESEYVFTEAGTIKELASLGGGKYKCIMEKRGDTDFHAFRVGDVLRGVVNNLENLGGGEYYTTWLHVESIDPHGDNSMVVSLYADTDCPSGRNYPPTDMMKVHRWGNSIPATEANHQNEEYRAFIDIVNGKYVNRRQSCWYLSSTEKRIVMLDGVTKPIVEDANYAAFFGLPYDIKDISGHSLNPTQPYIYCRGAFLQDLHFIDYKGQVIKIERFRGNWDSDVASSSDPYVTNSTTYDTVYHNNSKWECVAEQAIGEPTKDNIKEWKLLQEVLSTSIVQLVPSATSIQRDVNGEPYIDYVSCKIQKNTGDKIEILPTDNLYYSINGVSLTQGAYVPLAKNDGIEYIEFILMPTEGDKFGSAKFGEAKFASPIARTTVQIINDVKPAALRGPSEWKPNVEYLGGGRGESFQDIVMHTKDGVVEYYLCHVSHIGVEPGADTSLNTHWTKDKPWEKSQANDFVATKVMFAQRSVIVNLALNDAKAYPMKKDADGHYTDILDTEAEPTISIDGNTGKLTAKDADVSGSVTATGGNIGGFTIGTDTLQNNNYGASIEIYDENQTTKIGKSATDATTHLSCSMQAESTNYGSYNTALYLNARNAGYNYAFHGNGNGVLNGYVIGYAVERLMIYSDYFLSLNAGMTKIIKYTKSDGYLLRLPTLQNIRNTLGIGEYDTTDFCVQLNIINMAEYHVVIKGDDHDYSDLITDISARPRIFRKTGDDNVELHNAEVINLYISYIDRTFLAHYIKQ